MSRYARRKDNNQNEIVELIRWNGYSVLDLSGAGNGVPDLLISNAANMWLAEIKNKYGKLTPVQEKFHRNWGGKPIITAYSFEELLQKVKTS
jgi:hypothetical protein